MNNPYQSPQTEVGSEQDLPGKSLDKYYVVSRRKFILLYVLTFGIYAVYWSYKNWSIVKRDKKIDAWPVMRGLFLIFFIHSLMDRVAITARRSNIEIDSGYKGYATVVVVLIVVDRILDRLTRLAVGEPYLDILSVLLIVPMAIYFWKLQGVINVACGDRIGESNSRITGGNIAWMILGGCIWITAIIGFVTMIKNHQG